MTYGSSLETAQHVQKCLDHKNDLTWRNHRVLYIEKMMEYADVISQYVPITLLTGGVIRDNFNDKQHTKES